MNRPLSLVVFACLNTGFSLAHAGTPEPAETIQATAKAPAEESGWGATGYPIVFYSPETRAALGGGLALYKATPALRPEVTELEVFGTQMKQFELNLKQTTFFSGNRYELFGEFRLNRSPHMAFYGVGPDNPGALREEYLDRGIVFTPRFAVQLWKDVFLGPAFRIAAFSAGSLAPSGLLDQGALPGGHEELVIGVGATARWETTDSGFFPTRGFRTEATVLGHGQELGSDHDFLQLSMSHRHYIGLGGQHVLALQALATMSTGTIPWQMIPKLGGMSMLRGYYEGRYRDRHYLAAQVEYRFPVLWRISGAAFAAAGEVSGALTNLTSGPLRASGGAGLRFLLDRQEHINLRVDFAATSQGGSDFYVAMMEAF